MSDLPAAEQAALERALDLAASAPYPPGPNPRVGCVLLDDGGRILAEGQHRGAGTPHAEAEALSALPPGAQAAVAVVTLEPCTHHGRTPPCADALIAAGFRRVVVAHRDPTERAGGGARMLRAAGIEVIDDVPAPQAARAADVLHPWLFVLAHRRPWVTWKVATSLDGRSAARDGSSRWITSAASRADAHRMRAEHDVVLVGTGTALADDPSLTVRHGPAPERQPARAVMGLREVPPQATVRSDGKGYLYLRTRSVPAALAELHELGHRRVLLEGGAQLAAAFLGAGLVDEIVVYLAPALVGDGPSMVGDLGLDRIDQAIRPVLIDVTPMTPASESSTPHHTRSGLGDLRLTLRPPERSPSCSPD